MHWKLDTGTGGRVRLECVVVLLAILSSANSSSVLSDGDSSAGADDTNTGNTAAIEVDDVENDVGDGVIVDAAVEKEGNVDPVDERIRLFQYDPVEVGHIRYVQISPGRYVQLKTIAVRPPAFEISNFLTPEECERIKELALDAGLFTSTILSIDLSQSGIDETKVIYNATEWEQKFAKCDNNTDGILDFTEVLHCLPGLQEGDIVPPAILADLYMQLKLDLNSNGFIDAKELWLIHLENKTIEIEEWLSRWRGGELPKVTGRGRGRISEQTWINWSRYTDPTIRTIRDRVTALLKIDQNIVFSSESLQVVRYYPGGHYHAHWDSAKIEADKPCDHSHTDQSADSDVPVRICRFITILYYLQDVEGGGETAFPLAEFENVSKEYRDSLDYDYADLKHNCYKNLNVKPEHGKAIMWYNHHIDDETGWMSSLNTHSLHGGCDVTKGTKWIANNWITVDDVYERQMEFHAREFQPNEDNETAESENETDMSENDSTEEYDNDNEADDENETDIGENDSTEEYDNGNEADDENETDIGENDSTEEYDNGNEADKENETVDDENDSTEEYDNDNEADDEGIYEGKKESNNDDINDLTNDNAISTDKTIESTPSTDKTKRDDLLKGHTEL